MTRGQRVLRLMADTCVWLDLAKNISGEQLIAAVRVLVHQGRLQLLVPRLVIDEFERNRDRIKDDMTHSLDPTFRQVRIVLGGHRRDEGQQTALDQLDDLEHRVRLINQMATRHFSEILDLLRDGRILELSENVSQLVVQRALDKRAPFHRSKNSVADAVLLEMYRAIVSLGEDTGDEYCFVTLNTKDFSLPDGDTRQPHEDLAEAFVAPRSRYFTSLATALGAHFPEEADDLLADLHYHEEPRSLDEIGPAIDKLWDQIWYNRHKNLEYRIEVGEVTTVDEWRRENHDNTVTHAAWKLGEDAARRMEEKYGSDELGPWSDFEWGMLNGKLSALRWVMGDEWDFLDT